MATRQFIIKSLEKKVDDLKKQSVEALSKDMERNTRRNFNRVVDEVPAPDPFVSVYRIKPNEYTAKVICRGSQVLFIEFGAGVEHHAETSTVQLDVSGLREVEIAERPAGIYQIGGYGKHQGLNDTWYYTARVGRESKHAHYVRLNRHNEYVMITSGIRPVRALWRAMTNALRKLKNGGLKLK